jgi:hypothetical protein
MPGSIPLGQVAARAAMLDVACSRCTRRGRLRLADLVAKLGPDFPMTQLGAEVGADCSRRRDPGPGHRCDVYYPQLREIMYGEQAPSAQEKVASRANG